ncbi:MAG: tyrosine-type recombinase/integrase, partial [Deltaproteobacteria bacterium]|nr:tyrosine-type recombinase/integrase [Deltaproteobacteria bacterium]
QAFNALLFFFRHVLKKEFGELQDVVRAKRSRYIPVVLSREEVNAVIRNLYPPYDLVVKTLYGCGLRLFECLKLRVHNFNFDAGVLTIHDGKGKKDRTVPLLSTGTLLKIINLIFPSSLIQIAQGCNTNYEGFEQRPAPLTSRSTIRRDGQNVHSSCLVTATDGCRFNTDA